MAGLFDVFRGRTPLGKKFADLIRKYLPDVKRTREPEARPLAAPHPPALKGAPGTLAREFFRWREQQRRERGRLAGPEELADRPPPAVMDQQVQEFLRGTWLTLVSSFVSGAQYSWQKWEMTVRFFNTGNTAVISNVAPYEAEDFIRAPSHGIWIWDHVLVRGKGNKGKTQKPVRMV
jgi:hypothetical protein